MKENLCWTIGSGTEARCWANAWVLEVGPLISHVSSMDKPIVNYKIGDMVIDDGSWNLESFWTKLLKEIIWKIASIPPPHPLRGPNKISWFRTSNRGFSIKSAYQMMKGSMQNVRNYSWKVIWKYQGSHRVRFFLWPICKRRLFTNMERVRRGIGQNTTCLVC